MTWRENTQDENVIQDVLERNCYRLPDRFDAADVIVDVGAHIGAFTMACLLRGAGRVVAFEPDGESLEFLRKNVGDRAEIVPCPVGRSDRRTLVTFMRPKEPQRFTAQMVAVPDMDGDEVTVRLDLWLQMHNRIRLLKLDCEGAEYPFLHTTKELDRVQEIVGEFHPEYGEIMTGWDCSNEAMVKLLAGHGFTTEIVPDPQCPKVCQLFFAKRT